MRVSGLKVQPAAFSISRCPVAKADPRLSRSLDPSDNPYTKEAAVEHQYLASFGSVSLSDILSGKAQMKLPDPSRANLEKYSEKLEVKGLGSGIDWNAVQDIDLVGISADETEKIGDKIDYIASRYAVLKDRVASNCPLEQQKEQMAKLDSLLNRAFGGLMGKYIDFCSNSLEQCANSGVIDARQLYAPLNRSAVCKVYEKTMEQYCKSGDILDALAHGEQYAEQQYSQKTRSKDYNTLERYKSGSGFNNFFQAPKQWNPDYDVCMSDFQKYRLSLDSFANAVKSGNTSKIDFMFGSSGGLSIDNITPNNLFRYSQDPDWEDFG